MGRVRCDHNGGAPGPDGEELVAETTAPVTVQVPLRLVEDHDVRGGRQLQRQVGALALTTGTRLGSSDSMSEICHGATESRSSSAGTPTWWAVISRCSPMVRSGKKDGSTRKVTAPAPSGAAGSTAPWDAATLTSPSTGSISPAIVDISVNFPAPFGPVTATISPEVTCRLRWPTHRCARSCSRCREQGRAEESERGRTWNTRYRRPGDGGLGDPPTRQGRNG